MLRQLAKRELEEKLRIFKKILDEATTAEERESAQKYVDKYTAELKKFELPDEAFEA